MRVVAVSVEQRSLHCDASAIRRARTAQLPIVGFETSRWRAGISVSTASRDSWRHIYTPSNERARHTFPSTDDLSDDEEAFLRFLRDQLLQQTSYVQATHDNRDLRDQMKENTGAVREILERVADRGFVERRTGRFGAVGMQDIRIPSDG